MLKQLLHRFLVLTVFSILLISNLQAQPGTLNTDFNHNGIVTTGFPNQQNSQVFQIILQPDGKLIANGTVEINNVFHVALARYLKNGSPDVSFGNNGFIIDSADNGFSGSSDYSNGPLKTALALQPDGKILSAGNIITNAGDTLVKVVRYNTDGTIDNSFGSNGKATVKAEQLIIRMALQKNGSVVLLTSDYNYFFNNSYPIQLIRLTAAGALDAGFGAGGFAINDFGRRSYGNFAANLTIAADNKILVTGQIDSAQSTIAVLRYNTNGSMDSSFGTNGVATPPLSQYPFIGSNGIIQQPDGKIVVCGAVSWNEYSYLGVLVRYTNNGILDSAFGINGSSVINMGEYNGATEVHIQSDGKLVTVGSDAGKAYDFDVARNKKDGTADSSFGMDGVTRTAFNNSTDYAYVNSLQLTDSIIYVAGRINDSFGIVSYKNSGVLLPVTFLNFGGILQNTVAVLSWSTANEMNIKGYEMEKSSDGENFSDIAFIKGAGNTSSISNYSYTDVKVISGSNYYRLKQIDNDGRFSYSSVIKIDYSKFDWSILGNPAANNSWLQLQLDKTTNVSVQIVSINGKVIQTINKGNLTAGTYSIPLNLNNVSAGVYIVQLIADKSHYTKKIIK